MLCQCSSIAVLINKIVVVGSSKHLYKFDYVGVIDFGENGYLVIGEFAEFRCMFEFLDIHNFDSIVLMCFLVFCFVDITILSLPNFLDKNVILDNFVH